MNPTDFCDRPHFLTAIENLCYYCAASRLALQTKLWFPCLCSLVWLWHERCEMRAVQLGCLASPCHRLKGWLLFSFVFMSVLTSCTYVVKRITQTGFWLLGVFDAALLRMWEYFRHPDVTRCQRVSPTPCARLFTQTRKWSNGSVKCCRLSCCWLYFRQPCVAGKRLVTNIHANATTAMSWISFGIGQTNPNL